MERFRCECGTVYNVRPQPKIFTTLRLTCRCGITHVKHYPAWA